MAKVFFGGGLFMVEALTSGITAGSEGALLSWGGLALTALGTIPTAWGIAHFVFGGDTTPELLHESTP